MELSESDVFIDVGHGIGNAVLQAAYTRGCESKGIEVMDDRCHIAYLFRDNLAGINHIHMERDNDARTVGKVIIVQGDFTQKVHRQFVTCEGRRVVKAFVNNAHGVFGFRSAKSGAPQLDDYVAALFAGMCHGSIMVTLEPLSCLGRSLSEENSFRREVLKLEDHTDASFFECDRQSIGKCAVTWGDNEVFVYVYKRVVQSQTGASFICSRKLCCASSLCITTDAIRPDGDDTDTIGLLNDVCSVCNEKRMTSKRRTGTNQTQNVRTPVSLSSGKSGVEGGKASTAAPRVVIGSRKRIKYD